MKFSRKPQDPGAARHGAKLRLIDGAKPDEQYAVDRHGDGDGGGGGDHIAVKHRHEALVDGEGHRAHDGGGRRREQKRPPDLLPVPQIPADGAGV